MTNLESLHTQLRNSIAKGALQDIEQFKDSAFWKILSSDEKTALARLFLKAGEKALFKGDESALIELLVNAESLAGENPHILCKIALLLFKVGIMAQKGNYLFLALHQLKEAIKEGGADIADNFHWWLLCGNVLISMGQITSKEKYFEKALKKLDKARELLQPESDEEDRHALEWATGQAWVFLGKFSEERCDLQKGLHHFATGEAITTPSPSFWNDYGQALTFYGMSHNDKRYLLSGIELFKKAIDQSAKNDIHSFAHERGWQCYAIAMKNLFELTGKQEDFHLADQAYLEAILAAPSHAELWLSWGELFLRYGMLKSSYLLIEMALDKFTSIKAKESDPAKRGALIAQALIALGLLFDDLKFIREGEKQIEEILERFGESQALFLAQGLSQYALGSYFGDASFFSTALHFFQKGKDKSSSISFAYWLFRTYLAWGELSREAIYFRRALKLISRIVELRKWHPYYWNEWGEALVKFAEIEAEIHLLRQAGTKFAEAIQLSSGEEELLWYYNYGCLCDTLGTMTADESLHEKAMAILNQVHEKDALFKDVKYRLGLVFMHHGELTSNIEHLYQAIDLFDGLVKKGEEGEELLGELGYVLLLLSQLINDPQHPLKAVEMKKEAEGYLLRAAEQGNLNVYYHLSCLYSLSGLTTPAIDFLLRSDRAGVLPDLEDVINDEWLTPIKDNSYFQEFIAMKKRGTPFG